MIINQLVRNVHGISERLHGYRVLDEYCYNSFHKRTKVILAEYAKVVVIVIVIVKVM